MPTNWILPYKGGMSKWQEKAEKVKGGCSSHQIRNVVIEQLLLDDLQRVTNYARNHEAEFIQLVTKSSEKALEKEIRDSRREYDEAKARITKLDTLIQRIYEDNV